MYNAKMVLDSISSSGHRISTMVVTMPRCILAEFNTHRMLSRNSASSRAIPLHKMIEAVKTNPFIPLRWMKNHSGMQGTEYFGDLETFESTDPFTKGAPGIDADPVTRSSPGGLRIIKDRLREKWLWLRDIAVQEAEGLNNCGVHYHPNGDKDKLCGDGMGLTKQMCNRLLEPWMWHTVLVTATEWENFFALRLDPAAEIHMQKVAETMLECMNNSNPQVLKDGEWHIPYGDQIDEDKLEEVLRGPHAAPYVRKDGDMLQAKIEIATARCAQVSYTVIGEDQKSLNYNKLLELHDRLAKSGHWSPFEHCAMAMSTGSRIYSMNNGFSGNFRGWKQYRKQFKDENRPDSRLINKAIWDNN